MAGPTTQGPQKFCHACGKQIDARAEICPGCGVRQASARVGGEKSKIVAFILAWLFGTFGIHEFYLGKPGTGIAFIVVFILLLILTLGLLAWIPGLIAFCQGIYYLTMSDATFAAKYG